MKRFKGIFYFILVCVFCIPFLNVDALTCNSKVLSVSDKNFICSGIEGNTLIFTFNGQDYSMYFKLRSDGRTIDIDPAISFPTNVEIANIEVKDNSNSTTIKIKNEKYVTTTTTTTTTKVPENLVVVRFNDGNEISEKKCSKTEGSDSCVVYLPKLNTEGFNGWGTKDTCKDGITGNVKVYKNITYYACYNDGNETESKINIKELTILDKNTQEEINYGELDNTKDTYNFKVLYNVNSLIVNVVGDDNTEISVSGNEDLKVGINAVLIKISDNNGNQKTYTLNVERLEEGESLEKVHYLSSLVIGGSEINFNKDIFEYNVTIKSDIDQLLINKKALDENDIVTVKGNENLVNNSKVYIEVTGEDGITTTYTINVFKEEGINIFLILAIISTFSSLKALISN